MFFFSCVFHNKKKKNGNQICSPCFTSSFCFLEQKTVFKNYKQTKLKNNFQRIPELKKTLKLMVVLYVFKNSDQVQFSKKNQTGPQKIIVGMIVIIYV